MPTQEWVDRKRTPRDHWAIEACLIDQHFIQDVVNAVKNTQFIQTSICLSLESLPIPPEGCCPSPFIQHLCIIAQILYRSYGIEVQQIDDKEPPRIMTVTWHRDAHWLNPISPYEINARKEKFRTDCTLQFGTKLFPVHSTVLSAKSSVFEKMFQSECKEAEWGAVINIIMETFEEQSAEMLLDYFYTGELKLEGASVKRIDNLVNFSDRYAMPHLQQLCLEHLCKSVNADNLKEYIALARHYQHEELEAALIEHIGVEVTVDNFDRLMELGKADKLGVVFTLNCETGISEQIKKIDYEPFGLGKSTKLDEFRKFLDIAFQWHRSLTVFTIIGQMRKVLNHPGYSPLLEKLIEYLALVCEYQSRLETEGSWLQKSGNDIQTMKNDLLECKGVVELIKASGTRYSYEEINAIPIISPINLTLIEKCLTVAATYRLEELTTSCAAVLEQEFERCPVNHTFFTPEELYHILAIANQFDLKRVKEAYEKYMTAQQLVTDKNSTKN
jgi:ASC-1-like (ASCH) protein